MSDLKTIELLKRLLADAYDYEAAMGEHGISQGEIDELSKRLESCEAVPKGLFHKILLVALTASDRDIGYAEKMIDNYCKFGIDSPEFFKNRDVDSVEVQAVLNNMNFGILPPTPDNCNLVLGRLASFEPKDYMFDETSKTFMMLLGA